MATIFWNAKNGSVTISGGQMDYVVFGKGRECLVMIPGLGDGLVTVKGMARVLAVTYRMYAKNYTVYMFSRKNGLEKGCSTKDMARDQAEAMEALGILRAKVLGVSQGGMIAQYLAADYPYLVEKLVLAVTLSRADETAKKAIGRWISLAKQEDYQGLMIDTAEKTYTEKYLKRYRLCYPLLGLMGRHKAYGRFLIQAESCLSHDASSELWKILCPVLVIGGGKDKIAGRDASVCMAEKIPGSELYLYEEFGHGAYEEAKDFHRRVMDFFAK